MSAEERRAAASPDAERDRLAARAPRAPAPSPPAAAPPPEPELTDDAFLDGRVRLLQPATGYRAATDPVLLAAACPARPRQRVLDVGCGVGAAAFCLAARAPGVDLEGVEIQEAYADLSRRNAQRLGVGWLAHVADVRAAPLALRATSYDHVLTNPPYHAAGAALALDDPAKDAANRETADLETWLDFCLRRLKPKGSLTVIHRAERLDDILAALRGRAGGAAILPLWPRPGLPAKRVIVRAVKEGRGPLRLGRGLTLHGADGGAFSPEAEAVLRQGAPLDM